MKGKCGGLEGFPHMTLHHPTQAVAKSPTTTPPLRAALGPKTNHHGLPLGSRLPILTHPLVQYLSLQDLLNVVSYRATVLPPEHAS